MKSIRISTGFSYKPCHKVVLSASKTSTAFSAGHQKHQCVLHQLNWYNTELTHRVTWGHLCIVLLLIV